MYTPSAFRIEDPGKLSDFIQKHSFATLITHDGQAPFASHLPMLFRPEAGPHGTLVTHMARANPQWKHFAAGNEALAIFHGPHCYVSPAWYKTSPAVPTWNYAAVHAYGVPSIVSDQERVVALLRDLISTYEAAFDSPWSGDLPREYLDKMIQGIIAFEIPVSRIEGKYKFGQNRSPADIQGVIDVLSMSDDPDSQAVARMMSQECRSDA